jgi:hypothetical protein
MLPRILAAALSLVVLPIVSATLLVIAPLALVDGLHLARLPITNHLDELRIALSIVLLQREGV